MEKTIRKINKSEKEQYLKYMNKFEWKLINESEKGNKLILSFERDDSVTYYQELKDIEAMAIVKVIPLYILIILMIIGFALLTSFIVIAKVQGDSFNTILYMCVLLIPVLLVISSMVVITYIRNKQLTNFMNNEISLRQQINAKLDALKNKYKSLD